MQAPQQMVYAAVPQPVAYTEASGAFPMVQPAGQEIAGAPIELAGQIAYAAPEGIEGQQLGYSAPLVATAPARINVSHEIFAKLAAGGSLTPDEMAQLSG